MAEVVSRLWFFCSGNKQRPQADIERKSWSVPDGLFYNPTESVVADLWESTLDKFGLTTDIAKQLSAVLVQSQDSGRSAKWVAHSQGGVIFSEAISASNRDMSNLSVVFHGGANNELVTNNILSDAGVRTFGDGYLDHPFDPVSNIAGFNTANPVKIIGSVLALPLVMWGGESYSPHTHPYAKNDK